MIKRFYYDSKVAKVLLAFSSCHTITIGPFVFSKRSKDDIEQNVRNHETCHSIQWIELACITGIIVLILQLLFGCSAWWYFSAAIMFYLWYGIEFLVRLVLNRSFKKAYRAIAFEQEAYGSEKDCNYIENRPLFSWLKFITIA